MDSYNLSYTLGVEQLKRLSDLARRCRGINVWNEWLTTRLLSLSKGTPLADLDYQDIFQCLPAEKQQELMDKRRYFLTRSGISL